MVWLGRAVRLRAPDRPPYWWMAAALCPRRRRAVALYPIGLSPAGSMPPVRWLAVQTFLQFVSTCLRRRAPVAAAGADPREPPFWPWSPWCARCGLPSERWRASGLLACFAATLLVAAFVAVGRAELAIGAALHARYTTLAIAFVCLVYLTFTLYPGGRWLACPGCGWCWPSDGRRRAARPGLRRVPPAAARGARERRRPRPACRRHRRPQRSPVFQYSQGTSTYLSRLLAHRSWPFEHYEPDPRVRPQVIARRRCRSTR